MEEKDEDLQEVLGEEKEGVVGEEQEEEEKTKEEAVAFQSCISTYTLDLR